MTIAITKNEFRTIVKAGLASSDSLNDNKAGAVGMYEHLTINGKVFTQSLYAEEYGYSWQSTASGSTIFLKSESGDILKVTQIRYTKNGTTEGDKDAERIIKRFTSQQGGYREGAGRKPGTGPKKTTWSVKVTDEEREKLIRSLKELRGE